MAAVYSKRLVEAAINATSTVPYTVPANKVTVIRSISVLLTVSGITATVLRNGGAAIMFRLTSSAANQYVTQEGRWVLNTGEGLEIAGTGAGSIQFNINGYELDAL